MNMSSRKAVKEIPEEVSEPVRAVVELFRGPLEKVRFPDVDVAQLDALVGDVRDQVAEVAAARLALDNAQLALDQALGNLSKTATRGHAYASIFADGDVDLQEQLSGISIAPLNKQKRRKATTSRPKKRKSDDGPELPLPAEAGLELDATA